MKNNKMLYGIIGAVLLIVVNLIVFLSLKTYTAARWINIVGLNLSIIVLWGASIVFGKKETHFLQYAKFPIIGLYSVITFIISILFILINLQNVTVSIIVQVVLLALFIIAMSINTMANNDSIQKTGTEKVKQDDIKNMASRLEIAMQMVKDRDMYRKIENAYDAIKNTKINITGDASSIDGEIIRAIGNIENFISEQNMSGIENEVANINQYIRKRNQL